MKNTQARNIIQRLIDIGAIVPGLQTERLVDEVQTIIHDDYIPGGKTVNSATNLRDAPAGKRCCFKIGEDLQSGPFYCGDPATLMGDTSGGIVYTCEKHEPVLRRIEKKGSDTK